ncbi:LysR family transcriptional regulator [Pandoraea terrae]|uniref:LysR family transcriptional regulator n=1 Tax=Pandoraea terrae TaxID=1537710 RepID=A0A5E4RR67_9BURK|nr:LysR family transcriptional regulator [Pandoraea terrae]VVD65505.1 LysR family transcriptional regulator [Pandoraea terrae]
MIHFTLRQLAYFVAAARHGSTARAARAENVSQPSISHAIAELEAQWGEALFLRIHAQGIELTAAGRRRLAQAQRVLGEAARLASDDGARITGELSVGCFSTLGPLMFPAILRAVSKRHPDVIVRLHEGDTETLVAGVERGTLDLALMYDLGLDRPVRLTPIAEHAPYVLLPANHRLAKHDTLGAADLADEPFVLIDLPHSREYFLSIFGIAGVHPTVAYRTGSLEMARALVANGCGVSILVTRPARDVAYDGRRIVCKPLAGQFSPQRVVLVSARERPLSPAAEAFIDAARASAQPTGAHYDKSISTDCDSV